MKNLFLIFGLLLTNFSFAATIIVDINGGGHYTSINAAIAVANTNDTVKVWPGTYYEQVNLNKNIVLMGSGYENTIITGNFDPSIIMSSGKLQWFRVTSLTGTGIKISGGWVTNCVIIGCAGVGIYSNSGTGTITNCVVFKNGSYGIYAKSPGYLTVYNCISRNNTDVGFYGDYSGTCLNRISVSYSNGGRSCTSGNQGCINSDPMFMSDLDFHISEGSPSWNTGNPSLYDPDGSISDMGYFGGPDCPIYPVVTEIIITPSGNTINLKAKARANY